MEPSSGMTSQAWIAPGQSPSVLRRGWTSRDFAFVADIHPIVGERLCDAADVQPRDNVVEVSAGGGCAGLAAARRFADVTAVDEFPELLAHAEPKAEVEGFPILSRIADPVELPFAGEAFDVALSAFGVTFTREAACVARELVRVVRPGGRIAIASWLAGSFHAELMLELERFAPFASGGASPADWGRPGRIQELFAPHAEVERVRRRRFVARCLSPEHWLDYFLRREGAVMRAYESTNVANRPRLRSRLIALLERFNRGGRDSLTVPNEYLEVTLRRRESAGGSVPGPLGFPEPRRMRCGGPHPQELPS